MFEDHEGLIWFYSFSGELIYYNYSDNQIHCPSFNEELKKIVLTHGSLLNGVTRFEDTLIAYNYY
jgi:hypothetical protein